MNIIIRKIYGKTYKNDAEEDRLTQFFPKFIGIHP